MSKDRWAKDVIDYFKSELEMYKFLILNVDAKTLLEHTFKMQSRLFYVDVQLTNEWLQQVHEIIKVVECDTERELLYQIVTRIHNRMRSNMTKVKENFSHIYHKGTEGNYMINDIQYILKDGYYIHRLTYDISGGVIADDYIGDEKELFIITNTILKSIENAYGV